MKNPWLGLHSYPEGEPLFGRDEEIRELSARIQYNNQTVVYGRSGIGKSSIINAGVFPYLRQENILPLSIRLKHNDIPYTQQIIEAIRQTAKDHGCRIEELVAHPYDEAGYPLFDESLWEFFHRTRFYNAEEEQIRPLIVFDQFEEMFTLVKEARTLHGFFKEIGNLLNNIKPQEIINYENNRAAENSMPSEEDLCFEEAPEMTRKGRLASLLKRRTVRRSLFNYIEDTSFHIVFTIREDYLSYLERNTIGIPSLKQNRYCLQAINEEQAAEIILKPVPGLVDATTAELIIREVTHDQSFTLDGTPEIEVDSAVLSLYLSQIFEKMQADGAAHISADLIERFGGNIIEDFYCTTMQDYPEEVVAFLEDNLINDEFHRDNLSLARALAGCHLLTESMLQQLSGRRHGTTGIIRQYSYNNQEYIEFIHDILCPVIKARKDKREQMRIQEEERVRQEAETQRVIAEEQKKREEIERKAAAEKAELEAEALRTKKRSRTRLMYISFSAIFVIIFGVGLFLYDYRYNKQIFVEKFATYKLINGWPKGVGTELSDEECMKMPLYYQLCYTGSKNKGHFTDVYICSSNKYLYDGCRVSSLEWSDNPSTCEEIYYNNILSKVERIHFSSNEGDKRISKQELFFREDSLLLTMSYYHTSNNDALLRFLAPDGRNISIRSNGIDRIKLNWDANGRIVSQLYIDNTGVQQSISRDENIKGYLWDYSKTDTIIRYSIDEFGIPSSDIKANTVLSTRKGDSIITIFAHTSQIGQRYTQTPNKHGYVVSTKVKNNEYLSNLNGRKTATRYYTEDECGNVISIITEGDTLFGYPSIINKRYKDGKVSFEEHLASKNKPFMSNKRGIYKWEYEYNQDGKIIEEKQTNFNDVVCYHKKETSKKVDQAFINSLIELDNTKQIDYYEQVDSISAGMTITRYYGKGHSFINYPILVGSDSMYVHRIRTSEQITDSTKTIIKEFWQYDGRMIIAVPTNVIDGWRAAAYYKRTEEFDKDGNLISLLLQDENNTIIKSMMYFYQGGNRVGRAVKGIDGTPVRCDKWEEEGFLYYKFLFNRNYDSNYSRILPVDEWGHRSTIINNSRYLYAERKDFKGLSIFVLQNDGKKIYTNIYNSYSQLVFVDDPHKSNKEAAYLHILSHNSLIRKRINSNCDGYLITKFGKWAIGESLDLLESEWRNLLSKRGEVTLSVMIPTKEGYVCKDNITFYNDGQEYYRVHLHRMFLSNEEVFSLEY